MTLTTKRNIDLNCLKILEIEEISDRQAESCSGGVFKINYGHTPYHNLVEGNKSSVRPSDYYSESGSKGNFKFTVTNEGFGALGGDFFDLTYFNNGKIVKESRIRSGKQTTVYNKNIDRIAIRQTR